jgi:hypothetical protein
MPRDDKEARERARREPRTVHAQEGIAHAAAPDEAHQQRKLPPRGQRKRGRRS